MEQTFALPWIRNLLLAISVVAVLCAPASATEPGRPADVGTIFTKDGRVLQVFSFGREVERKIYWWEDGNRLSFVIGEAAQVRVLDNHWIEMALRDGRLIRAKDPKYKAPKGPTYNSLLGKNSRFNIYRSFYDKIENRWSHQSEEVYWRGVERVEFTATPGVKECPQCGKLFPGEYYFCPYDATSLAWRDAPDNTKAD